MTRKGRFLRQAEHRHAEMAAWLDSPEATAAFELVSKEALEESFAVAKRNCDFNASIEASRSHYWEDVKTCLRSLESGDECPCLCDRGWCDSCPWAYAHDAPCPWVKAKEMI